MDSDISTPEKKREYNASLFSVVAPRYDFATRALSFDKDKGWKRYILANLPEGEPGLILDVATGTGDFIKGFQTRFPDSEILGIDLNRDMLLYSSDRLKGERVSFSRQDMCAIGIRSGSADLVSAGYALRNAPDLRKALSEMYRVLKPGGCAVFLDFSKPANRVF
ncbi:MAG: class I SAM-dependent methyltransferase, partial [Chitinivibrionales bacterium]